MSTKKPARPRERLGLTGIPKKYALYCVPVAATEPKRLAVLQDHLVFAIGQRLQLHDSFDIDQHGAVNPYEAESGKASLDFRERIPHEPRLGLRLQRNVVSGCHRCIDICNT